MWLPSTVLGRDIIRHAILDICGHVCISGRRYSIHTDLQNPVAASQTHRGIVPTVATRSQCAGHSCDNRMYNGLYSWGLLPPGIFESGNGSDGIPDYRVVIRFWPGPDPPSVCRPVSGFF